MQKQHHLYVLRFQATSSFIQNSEADRSVKDTFTWYRCCHHARVILLRSF